MSGHRAWCERGPHQLRRLRAPGSRAAIVAALTVGFVLAVMAVWESSSAAFTAATPENGSWSTATVALTDDDTGSALINATATPGQSGTACIQVTYTGTTPAAVRLYATSGGDADGLGAKVALTVEEGTGGTFSGGCGGFVPTGPAVFNATFGSFISTATGFGSGLGTWTADPDISKTRSYRFTWAVAPDAPEELQGTSVSAAFVWESRAGS